MSPTEGCSNAISTAIGCIPLGFTELTTFLMKWAFGFGGGIAFLLIIYAGFQIISSQGDIKKIQSGKELLVASISGIVVMIFSIFILRLVGVNILGIF